ncbi:MAG: hypothetical protein SGBAC_004185, partial [Bacillariaceae sp.]
SVAIKKLNQKFGDWNDARSLREFRANVDLSKACTYVCQIYDIIREADGTLYFSMELMPDGTLNDYIESFRPQSQTSAGESGSARTHIAPSFIQSIVRQILRGLEHIHSKGYMHRDLKPENILMRGKQCKVTDFSLARMTLQKKSQTQIHSNHHGHHAVGHQSPSEPQHHLRDPSVSTPTHAMHNTLHHQPSKMTSYVSTRWYRAPEIILCAQQYSSAVDLFGLGCVMAELYKLDPLLPGSGEIPQLALICELWGGQLHWHQHWPEGKRLAEKMGLAVDHPPDGHRHQGRPSENERQVRCYPFESTCRSKLRVEVPSACERALALMEDCLRMDPNGRPTASMALQYEFFEPMDAKYSYQPSTISPSPVPSDAKTTEQNQNGSSTSFLYGPNTPPPTPAEFTDLLSPFRLDETSRLRNQSVATVVSMSRDVDPVISSRNHHYCPVNFLSPSNISNAGLDHSGMDKQSFVGRVDCKKRSTCQSTIHSDRKKRGKQYKAADAFFADTNF